MNRIVAVSICICALVGCGGDGAPTTSPPPAPTPAPPVPPPPPPVPPGVPSGLRVSASSEDFIEWTWNAVEGADGYDVQFSPNEAFTSEDEIIARTGEELSYRREGLAAGTSAYLRVRSASGSGDDRITSDWAAHVTGMTAAPEPTIPPPPAPTGLRISDRGEDFIEWTWDEVEGANGYVVQFSLDDDQFTEADQIVELDATTLSYRVGDLSASNEVFLRIRSFAGTDANRLESAWSDSVDGLTKSPAFVSPADEFLRTCPTRSEVDAIDRDLVLTFIEDPTMDRPLACTAAAGSVDLTETQLGAYQTLRLMKAAEFTEPLPWTTLSLYDWLLTAIDGIDFDSTVDRSHCCRGQRIVIKTQLTYNEYGSLYSGPYWNFAYRRDGYPETLGVAAVAWIELYVHEARHAEGVPHTCGGTEDATFAEAGAWNYAYHTLLWFRENYSPPDFFGTQDKSEMVDRRRIMCGHFCDGSCPG